MKNLRFILVTLFVLISCSQLTLFGQEIENPKGEWNTHLSYDRVMKAVQAKDKVFALSYASGRDGSVIKGDKGVLFSYDVSSGEYVTYSKVNGLSDSDINNMFYNKKEEALLIIYNNLNIDILYDDNSVANISDLKNSSTSLDFSISDAYMHGEFAYLSTNSGIIVVNLKSADITMTSVLNKKITSICIKDQTIYASTENSIIYSELSKNIQEPASWRLYPCDNEGFKGCVVTQVFFYKDFLHFVKNNKKGVFFIDKDSSVKAIKGKNANLISKVLSISEDFYMAIQEGGRSIYISKELGEVNRYVANYKFYDIEFVKEKNFWACYLDESAPYSRRLSLFEMTKEGMVVDKIMRVKPDGPTSELPYFIAHNNGRLLTVGGGYYLYKIFNNMATLDELDDNRWKNYDISKTNEILINEFNNKWMRAKNFVSVISSPKDKNHLFVCSWGEGVYEYLNGTFIKRHDTRNSKLEDIFGGVYYTRIDGLAYDRKGNLWMTNSLVKHGVKVLTEKGEWKSIYYKEMDGVSNLRHVMIDRNNNKWIISDFHKPAIFILDENGTFEDNSDDKFNSVTLLTNQRGSVLDITGMNSILEDKKGDIWLGTDIGLFYIRPENDIFKQNIVFNQVEIPRNDGSGYVDFLLDKVDITSIVIDKYNRKWIGTKSAGLYLLSEDGLKTIAHFSEDSSPLLSNEILSLAIDDDNGVLYAGTSQGLMSYRGELTLPVNEYGDKISLDIYPNPVNFKEFDDYITIKGLNRKSIVKITDLNMRLIIQKKVDDGVMYWDGRDSRGERVAIGTYLIFSSSEDDKKGLITKLLVID